MATKTKKVKSKKVKSKKSERPEWMGKAAKALARKMKKDSEKRKNNRPNNKGVVKTGGRKPTYKDKD